MNVVFAKSIYPHLLICKVVFMSGFQNERMIQQISLV